MAARSQLQAGAAHARDLAGRHMRACAPRWCAEYSAGRDGPGRRVKGGRVPACEVRRQVRMTRVPASVRHGPHRCILVNWLMFHGRIAREFGAQVRPAWHRACWTCRTNRLIPCAPWHATSQTFSRARHSHVDGPVLPAAGCKQACLPRLSGSGRYGAGAQAAALAASSMAYGGNRRPVSPGPIQHVGQIPPSERDRASGT